MTFLLALLAAVVLFDIYVVARALRTGILGFGSHAKHRLSDPVDYWFHLALAAAAVPAFAWIGWSVLQNPEEALRPGGFDAIAALAAAAFAFGLLRSLWTGVVGTGTLEFSRIEEPREYWILIALFAAAFLLVGWHALGFPEFP